MTFNCRGVSLTPMNSPSLRAAFVLIALLFTSFSQAKVSHSGAIDLDLLEVDEKGNETRVESDSGEFLLDWKLGKCSIQVGKIIYSCLLDTTQDIVNRKGELVMKSLPQIKLSGDTLGTMIRKLGLEDRQLKKIIGKIVDDTHASRAKGFLLPFYTCGDCEKNGKDLLLWNAFQSYVTRDISIQHAYLGNYKRIVFRMKLKNLKYSDGFYQVIGNDNADRYGN